MRSFVFFRKGQLSHELSVNAHAYTRPLKYHIEPQADAPPEANNVRTKTRVRPEGRSQERVTVTL